MKKFNFYSVIIGSELLNGRRKDAHFSFLNQELLKRGWEQKASFTIDDDPSFMYEIFKLIKSDKSSVMFCFGGIGATPDDYTRQTAARAFTNYAMEFHQEAKQLILNKFKEDSYPHRINMAYLPKKAKLLKNVINDIPGFYLEDRFFFTPGFPSMAKAMVIEALDKYFPKTKKKYRKTISINSGENDLIDVMRLIPRDLELSSLPKILGEEKKVVISLAGEEKDKIDKYFQYFIDFCEENNKNYILEDIQL